LEICIYKTLLLHRPDDFIDFTLNCPPTFYNKIAPMTVVVRILTEFTSCKAVVFNLFHPATHFATQFSLTTHFRKFPVKHMNCICVCTIENPMTKNNVRYHYLEQRLIY